MMRPAMEVADIVRTQGRQFLERYSSSLSYQQLKAFRAIVRCRTAALGGHTDKCVDWPVRSTHLLQLVPIAVLSQMPGAGPQPLASGTAARPPQHQLLPRRLHRASRTEPASADFSQAILRPALRGQFPDPAGGGRGSQAARCRDRISVGPAYVEFESAGYHVHCVVLAGGLSADHRRWIHTRHPLFLLPIPVLRTMFRNKFLDGLRQLHHKNQLDCRGPAADFRDPAWFEDLAARLGKKKWFVYAKPPFGGPAHVLRYLGRYTHRMAISNHRLLAFDGQKVTFLWRDYAHGSKQRVMALDAVEFLRRFFLHVLPKGFVRIRHYGLLSNRFRNQLLPLANELLATQGRQPLPMPPLPEGELWHCPRCGKAMRVVQRFTAAQLYLAAFDSS